MSNARTPRTTGIYTKRKLCLNFYYMFTPHLIMGQVFYGTDPWPTWPIHIYRPIWPMTRWPIVCSDTNNCRSVIRALAIVLDFYTLLHLYKRSGEWKRTAARNLPYAKFWTFAPPHRAVFNCPEALGTANRMGCRWKIIHHLGFDQK